MMGQKNKVGMMMAVMMGKKPSKSLKMTTSKMPKKSVVKGYSKKMK